MNKLLLNIQLFAEDEAEEETSVEETPTEEVEEQEIEQNEAQEEQSDEEVEEDKKDEKKTENSPKNEEKERNKQNAQRRIQERQKRQEEERKKQFETEKRKSYIEGVKKSTNGVNKFTNNPIVDEDDVEEYELMLELEAKGKDPIADYYQAVKEKTRAQRQKQLQEIEEKNKEEQSRNADIDAFIDKYGMETAQKISSDDEFMEFADGMLGTTPLTTIYEKFLAVQAKIEAKSEQKTIEKEARRMSSPGAPGKANTTPKDDWENLSQEEFHKLSVEIASRR